VLEKGSRNRWTPVWAELKEINGEVIGHGGKAMVNTPYSVVRQEARQFLLIKNAANEAKGRERGFREKT